MRRGRRNTPGRWPRPWSVLLGIVSNNDRGSAIETLASSFPRPRDSKLPTGLSLCLLLPLNILRIGGEGRGVGVEVQGRSAAWVDRRWCALCLCRAAKRISAVQAAADGRQRRWSGHRRTGARPAAWRGPSLSRRPTHGRSYPPAPDPAGARERKLWYYNAQRSSVGHYRLRLPHCDASAGLLARASPVTST